MFHVSRRGENRIDIDFSGKLDSQAMRAALDDLLFKSEGISHGRMLYRIGDFDLPTLGAVGVELSRLPHLFRFIRRFDRCAVVAGRSEEHTSELQSLMRISYAVFCLKTKKHTTLRYQSTYT